jgi:hypothetical protein
MDKKSTGKMWKALAELKFRRLGKDFYVTKRLGRDSVI